MSSQALPVLRALAWPIYIPTALFAAGVGAAVPVIPVVALSLGFDAAQTALILTATTVLAVAGPVPAGILMTSVGERAGLIGGGLVSVVGALLAAASVSIVRSPTLFVASLFAATAGQLFWDLGRQTYLADRVPPAVRARAMSVFGGTQRLGRVVGPLIGAGLLLTTGPAAVFVLLAALALVAVALVVRFVTPQDASPTTHSKPTRGGARLAPIDLVGLGVAGLALGRATRDLLVPLVGTAHGYDAAAISLAYGAGAAAELLLFLPGGVIMDRFGRLAVLAPCMIGLGAGLIALPFAVDYGVFVLVVAGMGVANGLGAGINKTLSVDYTPAFNRARYLGYWNTIVGTGELAGPALVATVTAIGSLAAACVACGAATGALAVWAVAWIRHLPPPDQA